MTSGRFFVAGTTAIFRTRHRPCERGSRCHSREKRKSNRLDLCYGQPRRPGYVVYDAVLGHFLSRQSTPRRLASLQRRPDAKSLYSSFLIHSCGSAVPNHSSFSHAFDPPQWPNKKSAPARGGGRDALEAPPAKRPGEFAS